MSNFVCSNICFICVLASSVRSFCNTKFGLILSIPKTVFKQKITTALTLCSITAPAITAVPVKVVSYNV